MFATPILDVVSSSILHLIPSGSVKSEDIFVEIDSPVFPIISVALNQICVVPSDTLIVTESWVVEVHCWLSNEYSTLWTPLPSPSSAEVCRSEIVAFSQEGSGPLETLLQHIVLQTHIY